MPASQSHTKHDPVTGRLFVSPGVAVIIARQSGTLPLTAAELAEQLNGKS
jgi:hypothetical protein